jgi:hypothetical protein
MWKPMAAAVVLACLAGCSPAQDTKTATAEISAFHQKLDAEDFEGIYQTADPAFKAASPEPSFVPLLAAIHHKLGKFQSGSMAGWNDNVTTNGHFITLNYSAKYERGDAMENFVYRVDAQPARLVGYHVSSNALIMN